MDGKQPSISPHNLYSLLGTEAAPSVIDVRRPADFAKAEVLILNAIHCPPDEADDWRKDLPFGRPIAVYCLDGHAVSQGVAAALLAAGIDAVYLDGGIAGWTEQRLPTRRNIGTTPGKWVTREHPKIDRIACPWLIRRFIDPNAEFTTMPVSAVHP